MNPPPILTKITTVHSLCCWGGRPATSHKGFRHTCWGTFQVLMGNLFLHIQAIQYLRMLSFIWYFIPIFSSGFVLFRQDLIRRTQHKIHLFVNSYHYYLNLNRYRPFITLNLNSFILPGIPSDYYNQRIKCDQLPFRVHLYI